MKSAIWLSSLALAAAGGWLAASAFAPPAAGKEPRLAQLTMDQLDEKQKSLGEQIILGQADSVHFDSSLAHQLATPARRPATVLIASTSATAPMQHPIPLRTATLPPDQPSSSG